MAVTVLTVYEQVCYALCEDGGFVLGVFTEAQFLEALAVVLLDFSQRSPIDKHIYTTQIQAAVSEYTVPDDVMVPELCFVGGRVIEKVTEPDLTQGHLQWKGQTDTPRQWHEDNLAPKRLQLFPKPNYSGAPIPGGGKYGGFFPSERNLTMVGPAAPSQTSWGIGDTLDGIPDSFTYYLVYGILEQIFSAEGETRDVQRALYCRTRYNEGIALASAIAREELMEVDE